MPRPVKRKVTVDLFRHAKTTNVIVPGRGKVRVVGPSAAAQSMAASRLRAKTAKRAIRGGGKIYSAEIDRALTAAVGMMEAAKEHGATIGKNPIRIRKVLGESHLFTSAAAEKECYKILEKEWKNDENKALEAWLKGETFHGTLMPASQAADLIIKKQLGLAVNVANGRKGLGGVVVKPREIYLGLASKSWNADAVFHRLTGKTSFELKPSVMIQESEKGIRIIVEKKPNKPLNATLRWRNYKGNITPRLLEILGKR